MSAWSKASLGRLSSGNQATFLASSFAIGFTSDISTSPLWAMEMTCSRGSRSGLLNAANCLRAMPVS